MRIVFWNCNGAFRDKRRHIERWEPDLAIVAETLKADAEQGVLGSPLTEASWIGAPSGNGLAVLGRHETRVRVHPHYDDRIPFVLPVIVDTPSPLIIIAVWTQNDPKGRRHGYVGWLHDAVDRYSNLLLHDTLIIGDFNSNAIWDHEHKGMSHSDLVARLANLGIASLHHQRSGEPHGRESRPTFFLTRNREKPFHIDYCFASRALVERVGSFEIGNSDPWLLRSDHMPLFLEFTAG